MPSQASARVVMPKLQTHERVALEHGAKLIAKYYNDYLPRIAPGQSRVTFISEFFDIIEFALRKGDVGLRLNEGGDLFTILDMITAGLSEKTDLPLDRRHKIAGTFIDYITGLMSDKLIMLLGTVVSRVVLNAEDEVRKKLDRLPGEAMGFID